MLERQHLTVRDYNKDQKAYASMLNKMYVAAKEGELEFDSATSVGDLCLRLHFRVSKRDDVKDCKMPMDYAELALNKRQLLSPSLLSSKTRVDNSERFKIPLHSTWPFKKGLRQEKQYGR